MILNILYIFVVQLTNNKTKMKELTAHQLETLTKSIFVRFNKKGDFKVLRGFNGETFLDYGQAMQFCCVHYDEVTIEIAEYKEALEGKGQEIRTKGIN